MVRVDLFISENQDKQLRKVAKRTGITRSEHFRRAIDEYLEKFRDKTKRPKKGVTGQ